jgi:hypothetical protein
MLITVRQTLRTTKYQDWIVTRADKIYALRTARVRSRDTLTTLRYVINLTLKLNTSDYRFLGNRRVSGFWITEWMEL